MAGYCGGSHYGCHRCWFGEKCNDPDLKESQESK